MEKQEQKELLEIVEQIRIDIRAYFKQVDQPTMYAELMEQPTHLELGLQRIEKIANKGRSPPHAKDVGFLAHLT